MYLYLYIYICIYVYIYVFMRVYIFIYIDKFMYTLEIKNHQKNSPLDLLIPSPY